MQSEAIQRLNKEVIANTQRKVSAMETRYNKVNKVEVFEKGDLVHLKIPVEDRCSTDNKRIFCRVVEVKHGNRYGLQCQYGILQGFYRTKNMDRLAATIPHQIPTFKKGSHHMLSLREAARLQSPVELMQVRCGCKGNCNTIRCKCFKAKVECTLHCHGQTDGVKCTNNGDLAAPSGTFNLIRKTIPRPSHHKRLQANTQGEATVQTYSTSVDDDSDLTKQDIEEGEGIEEYNDVDEEEDGEEPEEEEEEDEEEEEQEEQEEQVVVVVVEEDQAEEEENDESDLTELDIDEGEGLEEYKNVDALGEKEDNEEELVSSQDMEHSVIVVAARC
jgi:hypothetical protein